MNSIESSYMRRERESKQTKNRMMSEEEEAKNRPLLRTHLTSYIRMKLVD